MKTFKEICDALEKNVKAADGIHAALDLEICKANKSLSDGKVPALENLEEIAKLENDLYPIVQWSETLRVSKEYAEQLKHELSDEDATVALTKARTYTAYRVTVNKTTKRYEKVTKQTKFDMLGMLTKLGVNLTAFKQKMSVILCSVALLADKRVNKGKNKDTIIASYKSDDDIRKALKEEKNPGSLSYLQRAAQNAVNAYLPSAKFVASEEAAEFFYIISTKLDKRKVCGVTAGLVKETYEGFFDYANQLLLKDGKVKYNIEYKDQSPVVHEYVTAEDKTEGAAETSAAPTEPEAEKPVETTKPEPEKPVEVAEPEKPTVKRGNASPKSESKKSKTEKTAA